MLRTIAVLNTIPGSNMNIKEIICNYECALLARSLTDASGLPDHGGDGKSDLVHAVYNSIDSAWSDPWREELVVTVIAEMSAIFHLSNVVLIILNHIVKETSTLSTVIISTDTYEISLIALTRERCKGDHLSVQYEIAESTDISNVSIK